ncbi:hypothetical protein KSB_61230 [Ktedonobacter robiniae]|uniref:Uncharacterized protein n=1 Tax=Ktedonobacter robiniae TaxID=2778365 RepID=A0ABQ3UYA4_9CHLR|nr:hypothetical protein KSB_61230 [Ktedonobacter robiniae]
MGWKAMFLLKGSKPVPLEKAQRMLWSRLWEFRWQEDGKPCRQLLTIELLYLLRCSDLLGTRREDAIAPMAVAELLPLAHKILPALLLLLL